MGWNERTLEAVEVLNGGNPSQNYAHDATGQDDYATVLTTPDDGVTRHNLLIMLEAGHDAIVSIDGGDTDSFYVPGNTRWVLSGLAIPPNTAIQAKNAAAGQNYTNLRVQVW